MSLVICMSDLASAETWRQGLSTILETETVEVYPDVSDPEAVRVALVWRPPTGFFSRFPRLETVISLGAGVDHLRSDATLPPSLPVLRLTGPHMAAMLTEYALHYALRFHRDFDLYQRQQARRQWQAHGMRLARDRCVGVMGTGTIGAEIGRSFKRLGFDVAGWARTAQNPGFPVYAGPEGLGRFLNRSEIVVCVLPLTRDTHRILDAAALSFLPRGACLINIGRGSLVDEAALLASLDAGHLRGAVLDVFETEPLPPDSPLWTHPGVTVTPHVGGNVLPEWGIDAAAQAIRRFRAGERGRDVFDAEKGY